MTRRVRVASVPHRRRGDRGHPTLHTYSVRMDILSEEEQRRRWSGDPAKFEPLLRAQLKSRVWKICVTEPVPGGDPFSPKREDRVEGEGVIGEYPILEAGGPPFEYQSCVEREHDEESIVMSGEFAFVEGTLSRPAGNSSSPSVPPISSRERKFLFLVNRSSGLSVYGLRRRRAFATRACAFPAETSARLHSTGRQRFSERASNLSKVFQRRRLVAHRGVDAIPPRTRLRPRADDATPPPSTRPWTRTDCARRDIEANDRTHRTIRSPSPSPSPSPRERPGFPPRIRASRTVGRRRWRAPPLPSRRRGWERRRRRGRGMLVASRGGRRVVARAALAGRWIRRCVLRPGCGGSARAGTRVLGHGWFHGAGAGDGTTPPTSPRASFRRPKARGPGTVGSLRGAGQAASRRPERSMSTRVSES